MNGIPKRLTPAMRKYIVENDFYRTCIHENVQAADIEIEHALYYSGRKLQELFAVVPVRRKYNRNPPARVKGFNQWVACWRYVLSSREYRDMITDCYPKIDFYEKLIKLERRFEFDLVNYPALHSRLNKYAL